jgi:hypothetical protein
MIRLGSLLVLMASMGFVAVTDPAYAADAKKKDDAFVINIERGAGFTNPELTKPIDHYRFTVAKDGSWEFKPQKGESKKGKLGADDLNKWLKVIEDGGLDKVKSNPRLGATDEPYMDITVQTKDKKTQVRIRLEEKLSQAIEKKIVEVAKPDK